MAQGPPSRADGRAAPVSSTASAKVVGLGRPERLAEGATSGPPNAASTACASGWAGARTATVSSPARARSQTAAASRTGSTRVSGPGQNARRQTLGAVVEAAMRAAPPTSATWAIRGLKLGRPLAS